ncbi:hypothetical protein DV737_g866, partial [Chaetothyriales sp. CBS 132003]
MAAEHLGAGLLGQVQEESMQNPRDILGVERIDRLLELFRYLLTDLSPTAQLDWPTETETETETGHSTPKTRPAIIHLTSLSSSSFQSSPGKTSLLYHLTALSLLPPARGGKGSTAVWIDTDGRFSAQRLSRVIASILSGRGQDRHQETTTDLSGAQETQSIISSSLAHLHVIKPSSSSALLASLSQLPTYLLGLSTSRNRPLGLAILDSANSFHHQDPHSSFSVPNDELTTSPWTSFATLTLHLSRLPIPKFPSSMALDDCLRDRSRRQQAVAKGRVNVHVDTDTSKEHLRRMAAADFVIRVGIHGVEVEEEGEER